METPQTIITAIVSFLGGSGLVGMAKLIANRKQTQAEVELVQANKEKVLSGAAMDFVKELRKDVTDLRSQAQDQQQRAQELLRKITLLEDHARLQMQIIVKLRTALTGYNPADPLLQETIPQSPLTV